MLSLSSEQVEDLKLVLEMASDYARLHGPDGLPCASLHEIEQAVEDYENS